MKYPLVAVVVCYAAGLLLAETFQPPPAALFAISFFILVLVLGLEKLRPVLVWPLLMLVGWTNLTVHNTTVSPDDLRTLMGNETDLITVRGALMETPDLKIYERDGEQTEHALALVRVSELRRGEEWRPALGEIIVTTPSALASNFFAGQPVEISGVINPPPLPVAAGLFDYRTYLQRQGIYFQLKTASAADWKLLSTNSTPSLSDRFLAWSQKTLAYGLPEEDEPLRLLWAMTLGWKTALTGEVTAPFMESGTMHIFAISGLHIALIAGILVAILRTVQVPRFWCGVVIIPLIWFYTAATGWQPSAIRSTIMMTIIIAGWSLKRPSNLINSLAAAAFIILLYDPQQLFQASFQLSFFVVLSIALFMPPLEKFRDRLLQHDPLLPPELIPRWRRWSSTPLRVVLTSVAVSLAAWFGSWPLTAYYFHLFSPVTLLANLLIVPLSSAALACNLGSLICGGWFPWATELFNFSGWFWMKLMLEISQAVIQLPGAFFYVRSPGLADFAIYYGAMLAVMSGVAFQKKWRVATLICVVFIAGFYGWRWQTSRSTTTLTVLPLNGGHAVFVQSGKSGDDLLIDCGDTNAVDFITKPFLHAQGVNRLPQLALTQGDIRDVGGAQPLCDLFSVGQVVTSPVRFRSSVYRQTIAALERTPNRHGIVSRGDAIGAWKVLHPAATNQFSKADDNALVLNGKIYGAQVLLLSDLGRAGQSALLERTNDLRADIVIAGLPADGEPLSDALLDVIQPKMIIIADSEFPATRRAPAALLERLAQRNIPVICTRKSGAVTLTARPGGWELRTMDGQKFADR
ncbi:MAG TPA: ComEC/Rec2 family competence protein [Verrucomicrobiae bacterium]|nr:ComEC/Rec2 family competence protein [Verrucomicrobiae bacterium]